MNLNVSHNIVFFWHSLTGHEVGIIFLPSIFQYPVLFVNLCPSDLSISLKVRVGIWKDCDGRCVCRGNQNIQKPRISMGVISEVILWYLWGLFCGCDLKMGLIVSQPFQVGLGCAACHSWWSAPFHHGHSSFKMWVFHNKIWCSCCMSRRTGDVAKMWRGGVSPVR